MIIMSDNSFKNRVEAIVNQIPVGRVMTYGQIAALVGSPRAARVVGGVAHFGDPQLPWHRVVNKAGGLAKGYPGGRLAHGRHLSQENVEINEHGIKNVNNYLWWPEK